MLDEAVLDASVAIKILVDEQGSDEARTLALSGTRFAAPDFVLAEIANALLKHVRRGQVLRSYAEAALARAAGLFDELVPAHLLASRAFEVAVHHGTSAYDAMYVALAEARGLPLATADLRLIERASAMPIEFWTP
jgi:predicted nucleic acid-binding protein